MDRDTAVRFQTLELRALALEEENALLWARLRKQEAEIMNVYQMMESAHAKVERLCAARVRVVNG